MKTLSLVTDLLRQTSPLTSIEERPEIYEKDGSIELVVPRDWATHFNLLSPSTATLRGSDGVDHTVYLPGPVTGRASIEHFGELALLRMTRASEAAPASAAQRHIGGRRAVGAI